LRLVLEENFAFRYFAISLFIFVGVAGEEGVGLGVEAV
jgi:hypothetical protein